MVKFPTMESAKPLRCIARTLGLVLLALTVTAPAGADDAREEPQRIKILRGDRATLQAVQSFVDVDHRRDREAIWAYATPEDRERLRALGIPFEEAPETCGSVIDMLTAAEVQATGWNWAAHPTYSAYTARLQSFADTYPNLVRRVEIGSTTNTVRPHKLLALKISDRPDVAEDEPEVFLSSTMHGDETTGYVLLLHLIDELLTHYDPASLDPYDQEITRLVDSVEIWINPLANPDGTYSSSDEVLSNSSRRYYSNANGSNSFVDPNRNFADPQNGAHPDGNPYWAETQRMMEFGNAHTLRPVGELPRRRRGRELPLGHLERRRPRPSSARRRGLVPGGRAPLRRSGEGERPGGDRRQLLLLRPQLRRHHQRLGLVRDRRRPSGLDELVAALPRGHDRGVELQDRRLAAHAGLLDREPPGAPRLHRDGAHRHPRPGDRRLRHAARGDRAAAWARRRRSPRC